MKLLFFLWFFFRSKTFIFHCFSLLLASGTLKIESGILDLLGNFWSPAPGDRSRPHSCKNRNFTRVFTHFCPEKTLGFSHISKCFFDFFDPFLDPRDDAKTSPKHPQNFLEKLNFRPPELFWNMSGRCQKSVSYLTIYDIISYGIIWYHIIS